jgi:uncharacterized protein (DUF1330 family)
MPRGYWVTFYRSVSNPAALAEYAALAGPAIETGGGRFLARETATQVFEGGLQQRVVIIEFDKRGEGTPHLSKLRLPDCTEAAQMCSGARRAHYRGDAVTRLKHSAMGMASSAPKLADEIGTSTGKT